MKSTGWNEEEIVPLNDSGGSSSGRTRRTNNNISFAAPVATAAGGRSTSSDQDFDYSSGDDDDHDDDDDDDEGDEYFLKVDEPNNNSLEDAIRDKVARKEMRRADRLSVRLLAIDDDDEETESAILVDALGLDEDDVDETTPSPRSERQLYKRRGSGAGSRSNLQLSQQLHSGSIMGLSLRNTGRFRNLLDFYVEEAQKNAARKVCMMISLAVAFLLVFILLLYIGVVQRIVGRPPNQPVGPYALVERQEGFDFFQYYTFYVGRDSVGSNGYNMYVDRKSAEDAGICNVTYEDDVLDIYNNNAPAKLNEDDVKMDSSSVKKVQQRPRRHQRRRRNLQEQQQQQTASTTTTTTATNSSTAKYSTAEQVDYEKKKTAAVANMTTPTTTTTTTTTVTTMTSAQNVDKTKGTSTTRSSSSSSDMSEPFVYLGSSPTLAGPRDSIRLEGIRRFNRGLFIIDVRHLPAGCGVWPAFWLTDEANWPVNGEIDIVEGVNYQDMAKTAMHSTKGCAMDDIPLGTMTGTWDTAQGIPDAKTGIPDMTLRYAQNCFVYDPHQWLNQGCVAVDNQGGTLGIPLNEKGGGVYALEWDPVNRHVRSWVFSPHADVPDNLVQAIRTAHLTNEAERVMPDPDLWPLPYGYFAIGQGTNCPASHFKQMRLVLNTAFCGSVAGNRYFMDCPKQFKSFKTCNEYVKSNPEELKEAYWKIRGVYVYQREWERTWLT